MKTPTKASNGKGATASASKKSGSATKDSAASKSNGTSSSSNKGGAKKQTLTQSQDSLLLEFFVDELKDIYWAEKHLVKTLPKMQKAATTEQLKAAFADHLEVTKGQVARLEEVFDILGRAARAKKCEAMAGITKEGEEIIEDTEEGTATRDVGLIFAGQKVEHYEIASYGGLVQLAKVLGLDDAADLLQQTLDEEKEADDLLTNIAENDVNYEASTENEK